MLHVASVASAGSYIRTCRRIRNSKKIATIRDFHQNICVNPTIMGIYRVGPPSEYLKSFVLSFLFFIFLFVFVFCFSFLFFSFFFFSFLFFLSFIFFFHFFHFSFLFFIFFFFFCLSLSGPFSYGAPGHCPSMPPSRYATVPRCTTFMAAHTTGARYILYSAVPTETTVVAHSARDFCRVNKIPLIHYGVCYGRTVAFAGQIFH